MFCHAEKRHLGIMIFVLPCRHPNATSNADPESGHASDDQSVRNTNVPLVPPKPKELDNATLIFICLAVLGT